MRLLVTIAQASGFLCHQHPNDLRYWPGAVPRPLQCVAAGHSAVCKLILFREVTVKDLLTDTAARAARYIAEIDNRPVAPRAETIARLCTLGGPLPEGPSDPADLLGLLDEVGSPATVATTSGRYFGFVIGGTLPASLAANWLAGAWDQNASLQIMSPVTTKIEEIVQVWVLELLGLPANCGIGFVTGTTTANFSGLAAARSAILQRSGWNVEEDGMFGAPAIRVVVGEEVHVSVLSSTSTPLFAFRRAT